ncbi:MAG TPA: hypothetical protein VGP99_00340, partial [Tepidisphaeraceae bacterium]|nr:hypothetical protein [Tepidisphaeraceae bacterium]
MSRLLLLLLPVALLPYRLVSAAPKESEPLFLDPIDVNVPHISTDKSINYDYDIVYVRAPRAGDTTHKRFWTEIATPVYMQSGADLMLLHPDGSEELLVAAGGKSSITDPVVSFDGQWVYYVVLHDVSRGGQHEIPPGGSDIYKINLKTRIIVQLTRPDYEPNTGAAPAWPKDNSANYRRPDKSKQYDTNFYPYGVYNTGPCQLPGKRLVFTSNRNGFKPPKHPAPCLQL